MYLNGGVSSAQSAYRIQDPESWHQAQLDFYLHLRQTPHFFLIALPLSTPGQLHPRLRARKCTRIMRAQITARSSEHTDTTVPAPLRRGTHVKPHQMLRYISALYQNNFHWLRHLQL